MARLLTEPRRRFGELPPQRELLVLCRWTERASTATRVLLQSGFRAWTLSGGIRVRRLLAPHATSTGAAAVVRGCGVRGCGGAGVRGRGGAGVDRPPSVTPASRHVE
ncbi:MAG TPA: hypothetical protein PKC90_14350, partial [Phycisphaerales bacterium]|nr:hypothetical protein [Phycisphaerales bacterium]